MVFFRKLELAFAVDRNIRTYGGTGVLQRRQLADLVLPTGELVLGYPGTPLINVPSKVHPRVAPGRYSSFISFAHHPTGRNSFAYLSIRLSGASVSRWTSVGSFFTDSGTGCVVDRCLTESVRQQGKDLPWEKWYELKTSVFNEGDGSLRLDELTGANAIIFATLDGSWDCFVGYGRSGCPAWLVIDGRCPRWWEVWR